MTSSRPNIQEDGFSQINDIDDSDVIADIVFVHGLQGHPEATFSTSQERSLSTTQEAPNSDQGWGGLTRLFVSRQRPATRVREADNTKVFWPLDLLSQDARFQRSRILTWGYESKVINIWDAVSRQRITNLGRNLMVDLQQIRKNHPDRPLIFVAHSLGGILVKIALAKSRLQAQYSCICPFTIGIIFLGTPHKGSEAAEWGVLASNISMFALRSRNTAILDSLQPNSELLDTYSDEFVNMLSKELGHMSFHSFYETKGMSGIVGLSTEVVPRFSAVLQHARETEVGLNGNHSEICKFRNVNEAGYKAVAGALEDYLDVAEGILQETYERNQESFCHAVEIGDEATVTRLLAWGVDPDREEDHYIPNHQEGPKRPLWIAAQKGHYKIINLLLDCKKGVDVDAPSNNNSETALSQTAIYGKTAAATVLLDRGKANVNGVGYEWPPLCYAAHYFGRAELVRLLVDRGADVNKAIADGRTALHLAASPHRGEINRELIGTLLRSGADIEAKDVSGRTPERIAIEEDCPESALLLRTWRENVCRRGAMHSLKPHDSLTDSHHSDTSNLVLN